MTEYTTAQQMRRALNALYLEAPESVARDVGAKVEAYVAELEAARREDVGAGRARAELIARAELWLKHCALSHDPAKPDPLNLIEPELVRDLLAELAGEAGAAAQTAQQCPDCNGSGRRYYAREVTDGCDRCNATGVLPAQEPPRHADHCARWVPSLLNGRTQDSYRECTCGADPASPTTDETP